MQCYVVEFRRGPGSFQGIGLDREGTYFPASSLAAVEQFGELDDAKRAITNMCNGAASFLQPPVNALVGYFTFRIVHVAGKCFGDLFAQPVHVVEAAATRTTIGGAIQVKIRDVS